MTQANLENYALNKGYGKTIKEMTEAEKVTLRYNYVMDAMADAQGAAKREQDSFNGQLRYFKEQIIEIATRIGEQMMPVLEDLLKGINDFVEKIANLDDKGFKNIAKALVAVAAVAPLLLGVGKILGVVQTALNGWAGALRAIKGTKFAAFLAKTFGTAAMGPIVAVIAGVVAAIMTIGIALKQLWDRSENFRNAMLDIWESIKQSITNAVNNITGGKGFGGIKTAWEKVWAYLEPTWILFQEIVGVAAVVIGESISMIAGYFEGLVSIVKGVMTGNSQEVDKGVAKIFESTKKFIANITGYIKKIDWIGLGRTILDSVIKGISSLGSKLWETVQKLFNTALQTIKNINWDNLGQTLMRLIIKGISAIGSMIWNTLRGIFSSAKGNSEKSIDWKGIGLTIINMIVQGITVLMGVIWRTLRGALTEAWSSAKKIDWAGIGSAIINGITSRVSAIGSNIWNSIKNALNDAKTFARNIDWSSVGKNIVDSIVGGITGLASKIYNKITSAADTAKSWASGLWDNITGGKRSIDMSFTSNLPQMQRMAMPTMGNYYNPVASVGGHTISISVDARGDNADMIARRVERAIVRRIQS